MKPDTILLDTRTPEQFCSGHIRNSIFVPNIPTFNVWCESLVPKNQDILLICSPPETETIAVIEKLIEAGFTKIIGYLDGGYKTWKDFENEEIVLQICPPKNLIEEGAFENDSNQILDVRKPDEWACGVIANSKFLELANLVGFLSKPELSSQNFEKAKTVYVLCGAGTRATMGASWLQKNGFTDVRVIQGGKKDLVESGYVLVEKKDSQVEQY